MAEKNTPPRLRQPRNSPMSSGSTASGAAIFFFSAAHLAKCSSEERVLSW
jgi:hypothetical protein